MSEWVNGQPADQLSVRNRGLAYGDGLFETIAVHGGRPVLLARHLQRLTEGARRLILPLDIEQVRTELLECSARTGQGVLKLIITRGDSPRGYAADPAAEPVRILLSGPVASYPVEHATIGIKLYPCATRLAEQPLLAGLKHLNRLEQVVARAEWQTGDWAEGLMCDTSGRLIEGVYSNLFLVRDQVLYTADLARCGVAGVMRAELLEQALQSGVEVRVIDLWPTDLHLADEVFVCNSVYGVWPVRSFTSLDWLPGPLTRKLQGIARTLLDA